MVRHLCISLLRPWPRLGLRHLRPLRILLMLVFLKTPRSAPFQSHFSPWSQMYTGGSQIYVLGIDGPAATAVATEGLSRLSASQFRLLLPKSYEVGRFITPAYEEETGLVT